MLVLGELCRRHKVAVDCRIDGKINMAIHDVLGAVRTIRICGGLPGVDVLGTKRLWVARCPVHISGCRVRVLRGECSGTIEVRATEIIRHRRSEFNRWKRVVVVVVVQVSPLRLLGYL